MNMLLYQILASTIHKKKKISCKNNKFKISRPTWNDKFELHYGSYHVTDIQHYFEYIIKNHETMTGNPLLRIYVNKIENRITIKMKQGIISNF